MGVPAGHGVVEGAVVARVGGEADDLALGGGAGAAEGSGAADARVADGEEARAEE